MKELRAKLIAVTQPEYFSGVSSKEYQGEYHVYGISFSVRSNRQLESKIMIMMDGSQFQLYTDFDIRLALIKARIAERIIALDMDSHQDSYAYVILYEENMTEDDVRDSLIDSDLTS